jgi:hypothetical protein
LISHFLSGIFPLAFFVSSPIWFAVVSRGTFGEAKSRRRAVRGTSVYNGIAFNGASVVLYPRGACGMLTVFGCALRLACDVGLRCVVGQNSIASLLCVVAVAVQALFKHS